MWYRKKHCYPSRHRFLCLTPGIILAAVGMCIFAFAETESNYPYTHSAWHFCMSFSIVFLLPDKKQQLKGMLGMMYLFQHTNSPDDGTPMVAEKLPVNSDDLIVRAGVVFQLVVHSFIHSFISDLLTEHVYCSPIFSCFLQICIILCF